MRANAPLGLGTETSQPFWAGAPVNLSDKGDDDWQKQNQRWFRDLCALANDAQRAAEIDMGNLTPEQQSGLAQVVEPDLLQLIRAAGDALITLTDRLEALVAEQETEPPVETSAPIKRAPPEASAQVAA